jgi:hypothetical protein
MRNHLITSSAFVAALCCGLLLGACATSNGSEGEPLASTAQEAAATCESCMDSQCTELSRACLGDAACAETFNCSRKCAVTDKECVWECILARPDTAAPFFAAADCGQKACNPTCTLPSRVIDDCPVCSAKFCPQAINTCFGNRECWDLVSCVRNRCKPGDLECAQECIGEHPGGLAEVQGLRECSSQHCVQACTGRTTYDN